MSRAQFNAIHHLFPRLERLEETGLDGVREALQAVPEQVLVAAARSLCEGRDVAPSVADALRVVLLDDRLATQVSAIPTLLYSAWIDAAQTCSDTWPPVALAQLIDWLSMHPDIQLRVGAAHLVERIYSRIPSDCDAVLGRLVADTVPAVREAAELSLRYVLDAAVGLESVGMIARWTVAGSRGRRRAIARVLRGRSGRVGAASALEVLARDEHSDVRHSAVRTAAAETQPLGRRGRAILNRARRDPCDSVRHEAIRALG